MIDLHYSKYSDFSNHGLESKASALNAPTLPCTSTFYGAICCGNSCTLLWTLCPNRGSHTSDKPNVLLGIFEENNTELFDQNDKVKLFQCTGPSQHLQIKSNFIDKYSACLVNAHIALRNSHMTNMAADSCVTEAPNC